MIFIFRVVLKGGNGNFLAQNAFHIWNKTNASTSSRSGCSRKIDKNTEYSQVGSDRSKAKAKSSTGHLKSPCSSTRRSHSSSATSHSFSHWYSGNYFRCYKKVKKAICCEKRCGQVAPNPFFWFHENY